MFDACRAPIFLWNKYPFNFGEVLTHSFPLLFSVYKEAWQVGACMWPAGGGGVCMGRDGVCTWGGGGRACIYFWVDV